ncbi:hypothetical protein RRG08_011247 [Elysia crispata]|uniref:Uncharacterized protein n=1 Tax=Elysia crispata TaxID=231223 RepID=A0AAE0YNR9_9GAST|nr:hypothetical protein RRG08_011247 [Elysia crispata]
MKRGREGAEGHRCMGREVRMRRGREGAEGHRCMGERMFNFRLSLQTPLPRPLFWFSLFKSHPPIAPCPQDCGKMPGNCHRRVKFLSTISMNLHSPASPGRAAMLVFNCREDFFNWHFCSVAHNVSGQRSCMIQPCWCSIAVKISSTGIFALLHTMYLVKGHA